MHPAKRADSAKRLARGISAFSAARACLRHWHEIARNAPHRPATHPGRSRIPLPDMIARQTPVTADDPFRKASHPVLRGVDPVSDFAGEFTCGMG